MFGKNYERCGDFLTGLAAVRVAAIKSASAGDFFRALGFVEKKRVSPVRIKHDAHPDISCRAVDAILEGKDRPNTFMLKQTNLRYPIDETGITKGCRSFDILRAMSLCMGDSPLPFLYKRSRGDEITQAYITNENDFIDPATGNVMGFMGGISDFVELACTDYEWQQVVWSTRHSLSYTRDEAPSINGMRNVWSSMVDVKNKTGFYQSSSWLAMAGSNKGSRVTASSYYYLGYNSGELHIDLDNVNKIYAACKAFSFSTVKPLTLDGWTASVHGYVGALHSNRYDEISAGGKTLNINCNGTVSTGSSGIEHTRWISDAAVACLNRNASQHAGRIENLTARAFVPAESLLVKQAYAPVAKTPAASYDNPNDGSSYSVACTAYLMRFASPKKTPVVPTGLDPSLTSSALSAMTNSVSGIAYPEQFKKSFPRLHDVFVEYAKTFDRSEAKTELPFTDTGNWTGKHLLRSNQYLAAVSMYLVSDTGSEDRKMTVKFSNDDGYDASLFTGCTRYSVGIVDGKDKFVLNEGFKDGSTASAVYNVRQSQADEYAKNPGSFPLSWAAASSADASFTSEFKLFCLMNKERIESAAIGAAPVTVVEEAPSLASRTKPTVPKIPGVMGMDAQISAFHSAMTLGRPSMLVGPTGCGKTFLVRQYHKWDNERRKEAGEVELPLVIHTFHQESSPTEIIGKATLENGNVVWQESEFMKLFSNGGTYFADEFNFAPGGAHAPLFAALNGDDTIYVPEAGKTYSRHKDFKFVAACNPASKYGGRQPVDKALASRFFVSATFGYLSPLQEKKLLMSRIDTLTVAEAEKVVSFAKEIRKAEADGHLFIPLGTRDTLHIAELLKNGFEWGDAVEYGFAGKSDNDDQHSEILKIAGAVPSASFDDGEELKKKVEELKALNAGLKTELKTAKKDVEIYADKLNKFKAALAS